MRRLGSRTTTIALFAVLIPAASFSIAVGAEPGGEAPVTAVRPLGDQMLVRYATDGSEIHRYAGFSDVPALALYDPSTVLVVERQSNLITALNLDGSVAWTMPIHQPRCVSVLGSDRFLVCQDDPAALVEVDRSGKVVWQLRDPPVEVSGAVRLPDGNIAVAVGRHPGAGVHVYRRDGEKLWTWPEGVAQPKGLALLPTGEIAVSGQNPGDLVLVRPFSGESRTLQFCCHPYSVSTADDGYLLAAGWLVQRVHGWRSGDESAFDFKTRYPPTAAQKLPDGTVLVALFQEPDLQCLNAAAARERASRPLADYWIWLLLGVGAAALAVVSLQHRALWLHAFGRQLGAGPVPDDVAAATIPLTPRRRVEVGLYVALAIAFATAAAVHHTRYLSADRTQLWLHVVLVGAGGLFLALVQYRTPPHSREWSVRMASLEGMSRPSLPMWILWLLGIVLLAVGVWSVLQQREAWALAAWVGAVVLLAGGAIQKPVPATKRSVAGIAACALLFAAFFCIRVYRLEDYPANLHNDMAQWTKHTIALIDGVPRTMLAHGFAEIPLAGHVWSALWTALAGRSIAGARFASVAGSLLVLWGVFVLVRRLYGTCGAVVATACLGANHAFVHFSRIQAYMDPIPFHVLAVLGLVAGMESGRHAWFALAGLAGGYSALTYHAGRITPAVLLLLTSLLVLRYPRALLRRWPGLLLMALALVTMLGPYAVLFASGRLNALGRSEVYPFVVNQQVDYAALLQTLAIGVPRAFGALWFFSDTSVQYGSPLPVFPPAAAALLGMAVVAAALRFSDIRGLLVVLWAATVLVLGGALTINPPFWPRIVIAFVPAAIAIAASITWLARGLRVSLGRTGAAIALVATAGLLAYTSWTQLSYLADYYRGIRPGQTSPSQANQWVESAMGRDIQKWGDDAMVYIVSDNPREHSCHRATMEYYVLAVDVQDAREIGRYVPFADPRTIVAYFPPESFADMEIVRRHYPEAEERHFRDNLGRTVFARLVIRAPHS